MLMSAGRPARLHYMLVQNLFDKDAPLIGANYAGSTAFNSGNTFPSTYDALGRKYSVGARLKF